MKKKMYIFAEPIENTKRAYMQLTYGAVPSNSLHVIMNYMEIKSRDMAAA